MSSSYTLQPLASISLPSPAAAPPTRQTHRPTLPLHNHSSPHPPEPSTSSSRPQNWWLESLRAKTRSNHFHETVSVYNEIIHSGTQPDSFIFPAVLKAVASLQDLRLAKQIHAHAVQFGHGGVSVVSIANSLVNLYGKYGEVANARKVFDEITERDAVSLNSIISALCRDEEWEDALESFRLMMAENLELSSFTLVSAALACSNFHRGDGLLLGKQLHWYSLRNSHWKQTFTNNTLMAMYAKLGRVDYAKAMFQLFEGRDFVSWNTMISSLTQNEKFVDALVSLRVMVREGIKADGVTLSSVMVRCRGRKKKKKKKESLMWNCRGLKKLSFC
ncbi:Pentatricopeptide repeat-containing protein At3g57430, chloroplastic [Linum grandiflorum]